MKLLLILIVGFFCVGFLSRKFDTRTRWLLWLVAVAVVAYVTIK